MEDELDLSLDGKNLGNLRVVDLKQQLERRGLSKSGSKKDLVKRLKSQLEFEKLGEERKLASGGDLKLELDAATEQNEFVQQYLARQQKLLAEQTASAHTSESEEIQNSDEDEKCDSRDGYESNENLSKVCVNKSSDSEETDISKEQKIVNVKESTDNIEHKADINENLVKKLDTDAIIMPASKDLSSMNTCNQRQNPSEQVDCSSVPYSLSDIQLPESPKKDSVRTVPEKEDAKTIAEKKSSKSIAEKKSSKPIAEEEPTKSVARKMPTKSITEVEPTTPVEKESTKSVAENESVKCDDVQNVENEHEKSIKPVQGKTNGLQTPENSTVSKSTSSLSKSQDKALLLKSGDLNQNTKSSSNDQNDNEKHMKDTSRGRSGSADNKDSTNHGNKSKVLKHRSSPEKFSTGRSGSADDKDSTNDENKSKVLKRKSSPEKSSRGRSGSADDKDSTNDENKSKVLKHRSSPEKSSRGRSGSADDKNCTNDEKKSKVLKRRSSPEKSSRGRSDSADDKDSTNDENKSKALKRRSSPEKSSRKLAPSKNVSKETIKDRKKKMNSEDSGNQSSSDSGEYKSDEETKVTKALTPTRDIKRQYSRSESSESSSSESSQSSTKQSSKVPAKKPKVDSLKKTSGDKVKCPAESGAKTVFGGQSSKDIINLAPRQKLKIKRDNIILEQHTSSKQESSTEKNVLLAETRSDASMDKNALSDIPSSHSKEPENEEEISKPYVSRKVTLSNRKLSRSSVDEKEDSTQKKSKWGSFATAQKNSQNISISTSSLKSWFPDFKLINEPAPANEIMPMEQSPTLSDEKIINQTSEREGGIPKQPPLTKDLSEQNMQSVMEEEPIEQGPVSNIIFIQNLVRPFTLLQLKDLLKQHGNFVEGEFWIDKIKSKCIVVYETEEAAVKAKNALNNTRWPPSNPKILTVQYISEEEIEFHKRGGEPPKPTAPPVEAVECYDVKAVSPVEEIKRKDREIRREREKSKPLREWDKDKIVQDSPEREHYMNKENEKIKPVEKKEKKESKRRPNDDTPAKLLDDLFQKTKSSPCIYWLPLTAEQIKEKAEERRIRRLEQEMRILKEQEVGDRKKIVRPGHRSRERELPRSSSRSRSPVSRRR